MCSTEDSKNSCTVLLCFLSKTDQSMKFLNMNLLVQQGYDGCQHMFEMLKYVWKGDGGIGYSDTEQNVNCCR